MAGAMVESAAVTSPRPGLTLLHDTDIAAGHHHRWTDTGGVVSLLVQDVLGESRFGMAYCHRLLEVLDRQVKPNSVVPTVSSLPILACEASGGDPCRAAPVAAAWRLVRLAAKLFDDVEDGEPNGQPAEAINLATGLLFVARLALNELAAREIDLDLVRCLDRALNRAMLRACAGQHGDLVASQVGMASIDPEAWLEIALAKSGELLAWAAWAGALVAGADEHILACYRKYGSHLGVLLQVADDFNGVWHPEGTSDLAAGRPTLPVCYGLSVAEARERDFLQALLEQAVEGDDAAEAQARQLLVDLGAQAYLLVVGQVQRRQALEALRSAGCASPAGQQLVALLDRVLPALSADGTSVAAGPVLSAQEVSRWCGNSERCCPQATGGML